MKMMMIVVVDVDIWYDMIMMDVDAEDDVWMLETYRLQCKKIKSKS